MQVHYEISILLLLKSSYRVLSAYAETVLSMQEKTLNTDTNIRVFSKCTRMAIMPILASEALFRENKKFQ